MSEADLITPNGQEVQQAKPRGRQARQGAEKEERRRRSDTGPGRLMRLTVHGDLDPNYEYRWINDDPGRVRQLTVEDDWNVVDDLDSDSRNAGVGTATERVVDKGTGRKAILVRKRKEYYQEDKAKEANLLDEREDLMRQGIAPGQGGITTGENMYVPSGGISIKTGT